MRDKILKFVQEEGPVLPIEVGSKVDSNSLLANAYLEELVESNQIIASKEKVGSARLYYTKEQESQVEKRLSELGIDLNKTAATFAKKPTQATPELQKKREEFASRLNKIETEEQKREEKKAAEPIQVKPKKPALQLSLRPKPQIIPTPTKPLKAVGSFFKKRIAPKPIYSPPTPKGETFVDTALSYLEEKNIRLLTEPKELTAKESEVVVNVPSGVGPVKFLVKIKQKKKINKSDLMQYYAEALERRMPVVLLAEGDLATTAKAYLKEAGGFLRVKLFK